MMDINWIMNGKRKGGGGAVNKYPKYHCGVCGKETLNPDGICSDCNNGGGAACRKRHGGGAWVDKNTGQTKMNCPECGAEMLANQAEDGLCYKCAKETADRGYQYGYGYN